MKADFTRKLLRWNRTSNDRSMPWKGEKDPYKIWLSEIILQQTRVEQGLAYYHRFIDTYPTVQQLAAASDKDVFKLWEGLGYYSRCKNLIATAKTISTHYQGKFPQTYEEIITLKGIGPYTAAAIASFAFNLPYAVTDGNVFRVLSRYFGINTPVDSSRSRKMYQLLAQSLLPADQPGIYNQAIMDFGAIVCKPQRPDCNNCPQKDDCQALKLSAVPDLPVKEKQLVKRTRWFYYLVAGPKGHVLISERTQKDIWQHLYEFILFEHDGPLQPSQQNWLPLLPSSISKKSARVLLVSPVYRQQLTHQTIVAQFIEIETGTLSSMPQGFELVARSALAKYPFPKIIASYLQESATQGQLF